MTLFEADDIHGSIKYLGLIGDCLFGKWSLMGNDINLCPVLHWNLN